MTLDGLVKRGEMYIYRRVVPAALRSIIGAREIKRSLGTGDESAAVARWRKVKTEVDRVLADARSGRQSPAVAAYKAMEGWTPDEEQRSESISLLRSLVAEGTATPAQREVLHSLVETGTGDNPPVSIIFARYYAERKLPAKTRLEWDLVLSRLQKILGGDRPVRSVTQVHVRTLKDGLLATPAARGGKTLSPATVQKNLSGLRAVLSWAKRNGYITSNPAEDFTVVTNKSDEGRLPYSAEDLKALFAVEHDAERGKLGPEYHWLPWLALYTGARLEELGQLRVRDVRCEDDVWYLAIEPGDGKRVKTKSSRRRVPIHPKVEHFVQYAIFMQKQGHDRLFPGLKATSYGSLTAAWSKWWGRHARAIVSDPRKTFHSFRHGWKDAARAVMPEEHHDAITGHSNGSVGRSYGQGVPIKVLAESMAKVKFDL